MEAGADTDSGSDDVGRVCCQIAEARLFFEDVSITDSESDLGKQSLMIDPSNAPCQSFHCGCENWFSL